MDTRPFFLRRVGPENKATDSAMYQEQVLSYKHLDEPLDEGSFAFECILAGNLQPLLCVDLNSFTFKTLWTVPCIHTCLWDSSRN